ncbi:MAG: YrdB family protein [Actinomycetota bacterium]
MRVLALGLRFFLELFVLAAVGTFVWGSLDGTIAWIGAIGAPLLMAVVWGTFAVPRDPSRSDGAPVAVSGLVRIVIEVVFFGAGVFALAALANVYTAIAIALTIVVQYAMLGDRFRWLLDQPSPRRR